MTVHAKSVAPGFCGANITSLISPLIKEVIINSDNIAYEEQQIRQMSLNVTVMIPVTEETLKKPLNLYIEGIDSLPQVYALRSSTGPGNLKTTILAATETPSRRIIAINAAQQKDFFSSDPHTGIKSYIITMDVPLTITYSAGNQQPLQYLALAAAIYTYDNSPLQTDMFGTHSSQVDSSSAYRISDVTLLEILKDGGQVALNTDYAILKEDRLRLGTAGQIWPGSVYDGASANGLLIPGGAQTYQIGVPLVEMQECANYKIKDLRFLDPNNALKGFTAAGGGEDTSAPSDSYLSTPHYSRQGDGSATILLIFDYLKFLKNNMEFADVFRSEGAIQECATITEVKVYRTCTKQENLSNELTTATGRSGPLGLKPLRPVRINAQIQYFGLNDRICMLIHDDEIKTHKKNSYRYHLEVEMIDHSRTALEIMQNGLTTVLRNFDRYVDYFIGRGQSGFKHYKYLRENEILIKNNSNYKNLINYILASVQFIYGFLPNNGSLNYEAIKNTLLSMGCQYSATPTSIMILREIAAKYLDSLHRLLSTGEQISNRVVTPPTAVRRGDGMPPKTTKIFLNIHPLYHHYPRSSGGFDYLGSLPPLGAPISSISTVTQLDYDTFIERIRQEKSKYNIPDTNATTLNIFGSLSPAVIETGTGQQIEITKNMDFNVSLDILNSNEEVDSPIRRFTGPAQVEPNKSFLRRNLLNMEGVTVKPKIVSLQLLANESPNTIIETIDSSLYFSTGSNFVTNNISVADEISGSSEPIVNKIFNKDKSVINSKMVTYLIEAFVRDYKDLKLQNSGSILGSLPYNQLLYGNGLASIADQNMFEKDMNFNSVAEIQWFDPGTISEENRWKPMTLGKLNTLQVSGAGVLCRLKRKTATPVFNVRNKFDLPVYNELFILGGSLDSLPSNSLFPPAEDSVYIFEGTFQVKIEAMNNLGLYSYPTEDNAIYSEYLMSKNAVMVYSGGPT